MTVFIGWPGPPFPENEQEKSLIDLENCMDKDTWIGRACTEQLPGGGNTLGQKPEKHE